MPPTFVRPQFQEFGVLSSPADGMSATVLKRDFGTSRWLLFDDNTSLPVYEIGAGDFHSWRKRKAGADPHLSEPGLRGWHPSQFEYSRFLSRPQDSGEVRPTTISRRSTKIRFSLYRSPHSTR
jgi:hypothetical protein